MKKFLSLALIILASQISFSEQNGGKKLIVYFTEYENTGVDALSSASRVWQDKQYLGITEAMARLVQRFKGGDLFSIQVKNPYPPQWEALMDQAARDKAYAVTPELKNPHINLSEYKTIFLAFPIWERDMPRALYSFFDQYDFSGKRIYLMTASNDGPASTRAVISRLESGAEVSRQVLDIRNTYVENDSLYTRVRAWVKSLPL